METPQLNLGPEFVAPQPEEQADSGEWAASVAASREGQDPGYDERVSDAAVDQGFGEQDFDRPDTSTRFRDHSLELPGKDGRGRDSLPRGFEVQRGLTTETIARQNQINKAGVAAARLALKKTA